MTNRTVWLDGYLTALKQFAVWQDGTEYVGSTGTTWRQAEESAGRIFENSSSGSGAEYLLGKLWEIREETARNKVQACPEECS